MNKVSITCFGLSAPQSGIVFGIIMFLINMLGTYLGLTVLFGLIQLAMICGCLCFWILSLLNFQLNFSKRFCIYSKFIQISFFCLFVLNFALHSWIDPNLKVSIANAKVEQRSNKLREFEIRQNAKLENKQEELDNLFSEIVDMYSDFGMIRGYLISVVFLLGISFFISFIKKQ